MSSNTSNGGGAGVTGLLQVLFIGLKLVGVIDWSWWWVMAPTWGTLSLAALAGLVYVGILLYEKKNA